MSVGLLEQAADALGPLCEEINRWQAASGTTRGGAQAAVQLVRVRLTTVCR